MLVWIWSAARKACPAHRREMQGSRVLQRWPEVQGAEVLLGLRWVAVGWQGVVDPAGSSSGTLW